MRHFWILFVCFSFNSLGQKDIDSLMQEFESDTPLINAFMAKSVLGDEKVYFLDARERKEFDVSHIPNARHVGYSHFNRRSLQKIEKDALIIVYCSLGYRSDEIAQKVRQAGFTNVRNLSGGLFLWSNRNYPMDDSDENETHNIHGYSKEWSEYIFNGNITY